MLKGVNTFYIPSLLYFDKKMVNEDEKMEFTLY